MQFRPIIFSTPMVQAILNGTKSETRRIINQRPFLHKQYCSIKGKSEWYGLKGSHNDNTKEWIKFSKVKVGDVLWVRETMIKNTNSNSYWPVADGYSRSKDGFGNYFKSEKTLPSIFMPKTACRLFLKVKNIRVERLHDISSDDILKEGVRIPVSNKANGNNKVVFELNKDSSALSFLPDNCMHNDAPLLTQNQLLKAFWAELWCKINGIKSWDINPFVWVIEFEKIEKPLSFLGKQCSFTSTECTRNCQNGCHENA